MALSGIVDRFDSAHEFIVAVGVVMLLSSVWGSFVQWQDERKIKEEARQTERADLAESNRSPDPHGSSWNGINIPGPKDKDFSNSSRFSK